MAFLIHMLRVRDFLHSCCAINWSDPVVLPNSPTVQTLHFGSSLWTELQQNSPKTVGSFQIVTLYWCLCLFTTLNLEKQTSTCVDSQNTLSSLAVSCRIECNSLEYCGYECSVWMTLTIFVTGKSMDFYSGTLSIATSSIGNKAKGNNLIV